MSTDFGTWLATIGGEWTLSAGAYGDATLVGIPFADEEGALVTEVLDGSEGERLWVDLSDGGLLGNHGHAEALARLVQSAPKLVQALKRLDAAIEAYANTGRSWSGQIAAIEELNNARIGWRLLARRIERGAVEAGEGRA